MSRRRRTEDEKAWDEAKGVLDTLLVFAALFGGTPLVIAWGSELLIDALGRWGPFLLTPAAVLLVLRLRVGAGDLWAVVAASGLAIFVMALPVLLAVAVFLGGGGLAAGVPILIFAICFGTVGWRLFRSLRRARQAIQAARSQAGNAFPVIPIDPPSNPTPHPIDNDRGPK